MRRRPESRRKWQSNFPRKEERSLSLAWRMPSRCGLPGHSPAWLGRNAKDHSPSPSLPRQDWSLGFFASPLPKPGRAFPWHPHSHQPLLSFPSGTPTCLFNAPAALHPSEAPSPAAAPGSHCPLAPFQFTVGTADVTPPPRAHNLGRKLPRILALCSASAGTGAGDPGVPLKALPSSRRGSGSLLRHPRCPWAAGGWGEVLVGTLRSRCPA